MKIGKNKQLLCKDYTSRIKASSHNVKVLIASQVTKTNNTNRHRLKENVSPNLIKGDNYNCKNTLNLGH